MELGIAGRVAVVTGASRGIGRAVAEVLAAEGADLVVSARGRDSLDEAAENLRTLGARVTAVVGDVTDPATTGAVARAALDGYGRADIVVNNAGGDSGHLPIDRLTDDDWERAYRLYVVSAMRLTAAVLPAMRDAGWGRSRRCRKRRRAQGEQPQRKSPLGEFKPIADRPAVADERSEPGHLEGDLILGAGNRSAIVTVFDRATRMAWLADLPEDHGAASTLAALIELCERIPPQFRKTLTWDQGREMARWAELETACKIDVYFAEPHHPWQRPTNENGNGLLRRYVGKGTDLSKFTPDDLRRIETRLNTMPRRIFQWKSSQEISNNATLQATR